MGGGALSAVLDLADLAAEQWGLVTTAQARFLGVSPQAMARLANQGTLERMTHGVHRLTGAPPSPLDDLRAAWLAFDPARRAGERLRDESVSVVVSHRSAAMIHELGDVEADQYEFTSEKRRQTRRPDIRIHRARIGAGEWTVVDGLPVTSVVRTVDDLAAARVDGGHLASVVRDALTRRQVDDQQLITALRHHAHHYNARMGDGEALLSKFLQESGIPEPIERAVELARSRAPGNAGEHRGDRGSDEKLQLQRLGEQLESARHVITPLIQLGEQIANSPMTKEAADAAERTRSVTDVPVTKAVADMVEQPAGTVVPQEFTKQYAALVEAPPMKAVAELVRHLQSEVIQDLAKQHAEVAEASRLAREVSEAARVSASLLFERDLPDSEDGQ